MDKFLKLKAVCNTDWEYDCDCDENEDCTCEIGQVIDRIEELLEKTAAHDRDECFCPDCREVIAIGFIEIEAAIKDIVGSDKNFNLDCVREKKNIQGAELWLTVERNGKEIGRVLVDETDKKVYDNIFSLMLGVGKVIEKSGYTNDVKVPESREVVLDPDYKNVIHNLKEGNPDKWLIEIYPNIKIQHNCLWCGEDEVEIVKVENSELYQCTKCEYENSEEDFSMVYVDAYCPTCEEIETHWIEDLEEKDNCVIGECWGCEEKNTIKIDVLKKVDSAISVPKR